jgi:predicted transcriptional regulator
MATLGQLERSVMDELWDSAEPLVADDLRDRLAAAGDQRAGQRELAVTTVLTVLSRLEKKGMISRDRSARPHRWRAAASREEHVAELMHDALGDAGDRDREAVLARFVGRVTPEDAAALRRLLGSADPGADAAG